MKCDNCGKEEVNFHYTSNINGNITEKHLCADCAGKLGYGDKSVMRPDMSFEDIFMDLFGGRSTGRMLGGYSMMFPTFIIPTIGLIVPDTSSSSAATGVAEKPAEISVEVDVEMKKRREINIMREQMHKAAEEENFEKAAALRDSIIKLESSEN